MPRKVPKISELKKLLALSGNRCAFEDCSQKLVVDGVFIGHIAHITAAEQGGPRYDVTLSDEKRALADNLILFCPTHHAVIDNRNLESKFTAEKIRKMKAVHEKKTEKDASLASDDIIDQIFGNLSISQINTNMGSGIQLNSQTNIFYDTKEYKNHKEMLRNNLNVATTEIRRLLKADILDLGSIQSHIDVINEVALDAVKNADSDLLSACINQLKKVATWCFNDNGVVGSVNGTSLIKVLEMIIKVIYLLGAYAVDVEDFDAIRKLAKADIYITHNDNLASAISEAYMAVYRPSHTDLFEDIRDFVNENFREELAWKEEEVIGNLVIFEYLANIYCTFNDPDQAFPGNFGFYRRNKIYTYLERLVSNREMYGLAFPGYDAQKLANIIKSYNSGLSAQSYRTWSPGFRSHSSLEQFVEQNTQVLQ